MTDKKAPPMEFWVDLHGNAHGIGVPFFGGKDGRTKMPYTHVIEFSAYESMRERAEKAEKNFISKTEWDSQDQQIAKLEADKALLVEALKEIEKDRVVYPNGQVDKNLLTWTAGVAKTALEKVDKK